MKKPNNRVRCDLCKCPFECHHKIHEKDGKKYHTSCVKKVTPLLTEESSDSWSEEFDKLMECKWQDGKPTDWLLDEQGREEVKGFIKNLLSQTATEHYARGRLKACEQMHGELKEQELIHAQCEKQAKDAIDIIKSETIKEVEDIILKLHKQPDCSENDKQECTPTCGYNKALKDISDLLTP